MQDITPFHLAIPVRDIAESRAFYGGLLGCAEGRSAAHWVDFNLFGHQLVCHRADNYPGATRDTHEYLRSKKKLTPCLTRSLVIRRPPADLLINILSSSILATHAVHTSVPHQLLSVNCTPSLPLLIVLICTMYIFSLTAPFI